MTKSKLGNSITQAIGNDESRVEPSFTSEPAANSEVEIPKSHKTKKTKPQKVKRPSSNGGGVHFFGGLLKLLIVIAVVVGIVYFGQDYINPQQSKIQSEIVDVKNNTTEIALNLEDANHTIRDIQENVTGLLSSDQVHDQDIHEIKAVMAEAKTLESNISTNADALTLIQDQLDTVITKVEAMTDTTVRNSKEIASIKAELKKTPKVVVPKITTPKPLVVKVPKLPEMFHNARLVSADLWGNQQYAILKKSDGTWLPVAVGDSFDGWRLVQVTPRKAVFQNEDQIEEINAIAEK